MLRKLKYFLKKGHTGHMSKKHLLFAQSLCSAPSSHKPIITVQMIERRARHIIKFQQK